MTTMIDTTMPFEFSCLVLAFAGLVLSAAIYVLVCAALRFYELKIDRLWKCEKEEPSVSE